MNFFHFFIFQEYTRHIMYCTYVQYSFYKIGTQPVSKPHGLSVPVFLLLSLICTSFISGLKKFSLFQFPLKWKWNSILSNSPSIRLLLYCNEPGLQLTRVSLLYNWLMYNLYNIYQPTYLFLYLSYHTHSSFRFCEHTWIHGPQPDTLFCSVLFDCIVLYCIVLYHILSYPPSSPQRDITEYCFILFTLYHITSLNLSCYNTSIDSATGH